MTKLSAKCVGAGPRVLDDVTSEFAIICNHIYSDDFSEADSTARHHVNVPACKTDDVLWGTALQHSSSAQLLAWCLQRDLTCSMMDSGNHAWGQLFLDLA